MLKNYLKHALHKKGYAFLYTYHPNSELLITLRNVSLSESDAHTYLYIKHTRSEECKHISREIE